MQTLNNDSTADETVVISRRQRFNAAGVACGAIGAALLILGLVGLARADLDRTFNSPVFHVAGFAHTQTLALIEVVLGALMLLAGMNSSFAGMRVLGAITAVGATVALIEPGVLAGELLIDRTYALVMLALGAATVLATVVLPTIEHESRVVATHHEEGHDAHGT